MIEPLIWTAFLLCLAAFLWWKTPLFSELHASLEELLLRRENYSERSPDVGADGIVGIATPAGETA